MAGGPDDPLGRGWTWNRILEAKTTTMAKIDLNEMETAVLRRLADAGHELPISVLTGAGLQREAIRSRVDRLESRLLVESRTDGQTRIVALTEIGRRLWSARQAEQDVHAGER